MDGLQLLPCDLNSKPVPDICFWIVDLACPWSCSLSALLLLTSASSWPWLTFADSRFHLNWVVTTICLCIFPVWPQLSPDYNIPLLIFYVISVCLLNMNLPATLPAICLPSTTACPDLASSLLCVPVSWSDVFQCTFLYWHFFQSTQATLGQANLLERASMNWNLDTCATLCLLTPCAPL